MLHTVDNTGHCSPCEKHNNLNNNTILKKHSPYEKHNNLNNNTILKKHLQRNKNFLLDLSPT